MSDTTAPAADAPQWAILELMGHIRYGGQVSKDTQFCTPMLRVEVPQPDGKSFVSQLVNPSSIYRLTFCSEEIARYAAKQGQSAPMQAWELRHLGLPDGDEDNTQDATLTGEFEEQEENRLEFESETVNHG
jgi:hypothetical protein